MKRSGFTLIELLIVVVVIGILAAVGIPKFANSKVKAYTTAMKSDLRNLINAQESFFADSARYTSNLTSLGFKPSSGVNPPVIGVNTTNPLLPVSGEGEPACK
jgi:type IV pilus assembly protein PilA